MSGGIMLGSQPEAAWHPICLCCNQLRTGVTVSDITLVFGAIEDRGINQMVNDDKIAVQMSPITAKLLLKNLEMIVSAYESVIGNLSPAPKQLRKSKLSRKV